MHHCTAPQIKDVLPHPTVASTSALPTSHVRQGMFDGHALPQFGPSLRRLLTFAQLLQQGFIGMNADAAARGAGGTAVPQCTARTSRRWEFAQSPRLKGHADAAWTLQSVPLPIQQERAFGEIRPLMDGPRLAENRHLLGALLHPGTGQIRPVAMQFLQRALLGCQSRSDRLGDAGFWHMRGCDPYRHEQPIIQIPQDMALVAIHEQTATLAAMTHFRVLNTDA